jgi:nitroreductase/NAD-dependent dihydropyrimidine dehydrogenase PreA subunit
METIVLYEEKCIKCGKCIEECPSDVLSMNESIHIVNPELCISCGHCAAICPQTAIASSDENTRNLFKISICDENLSTNQTFFQTKRSIRKFIDQKVDKDDLTEIIKYAEMAPSSHNLRNREYLVITDKNDIKQVSKKIIRVYKSLLKVLNPATLWFISFFNKNAYRELKEMVASFKNLVEQSKQGNDKVFRNSKCIICISAPNGSTHSKDDCVAAQQYLMLYAHNIGIGSFIVGYAQYAHKVIEKYFKIQSGFSVFSVCALGYAKNKYKNSVVYKSPEITWR